MLAHQPVKVPGVFIRRGLGPGHRAAGCRHRSGYPARATHAVQPSSPSATPAKALALCSGLRPGYLARSARISSTKRRPSIKVSSSLWPGRACTACRQAFHGCHKFHSLSSSAWCATQARGFVQHHLGRFAKHDFACFQADLRDDPAPVRCTCGERWSFSAVRCGIIAESVFTVDMHAGYRLIGDTSREART